MNTSGKANSIYDLAILTPDRLKSVYPLVRHHNDSIDFDTWRDFATPLIDGLAADQRPSTGIIVASRCGAARGMFVYMRLPHLGLGRVLLVPHAFCAELLRTTPLWALLLREMMTIAVDLGCAMVRLVVHQPWGDLTTAIRQMTSFLSSCCRSATKSAISNSWKSHFASCRQLTQIKVQRRITHHP